MISLQELDSYLNHLLQPGLLTDYCPNGLQVEGTSEVKKIATAVSASLETIQAAAQAGVQVLIVHHGLFWQGDSFTIQGNKKKKLETLLNNKISLFAYHLPLDMHQEVGNNWQAARELGWQDLEPFGFIKGVPIGVRGKFKEISREGFQKKLEQYYQHKAAIVLGGKTSIQSAGLISGGAHKNIFDAIAAGVDAYVTGTVDEPTWYQAREEGQGINFYALGHAATEKVGPRTLAEHLKVNLKVDSNFIDIENPF